MKEIKAFIHPHRTAAVIQAIRDSGFFDAHAVGGDCHIAVSQVQTVQAATDAGQQHYSVELGEPVVLQTKLELVCSDEVVGALVELIVRTGHIGQSNSGWLHVFQLERRVAIA